MFVSKKKAVINGFFYVAYFIINNFASINNTPCQVMQ